MCQHSLAAIRRSLFESYVVRSDPVCRELATDSSGSVNDDCLDTEPPLIPPTITTFARLRHSSSDWLFFNDAELRAAVSGVSATSVDDGKLLRKFILAEIGDTLTMQSLER